MSDFITDNLPQEQDAQISENPSTEDLTEAVPIVDSLPEEYQTEQPLEQELTELQQLINKRTGFWQVLLDSADAKWIKNACRDKFEYTGPSEAFMLVNCFVGFSAAISRVESESPKKEDQEVSLILQASAIEACLFFINRYKGSGLDGAQRLFRIAMKFNSIATEMRKLDTEIEKLKAAEEQKS